jgi:membrane-associated phospholipid phosphatase
MKKGMAMRECFHYFKKNWQIAFNHKHFIIEFITAFLFLICTLLLFSKFTQFVELRKGFQFNDPVLSFFRAINLSAIIFAMIYGGIVLALLVLVSNPYKLMILFEAYALMVLIRMMMMFVLPLSPPIGMILLKDPFVEYFGSGKTLVNDLFFSGHTATLFLLYFGVPKKNKKIFLIIAILVGGSVLLQKAHYTVDVLVAPSISFSCYHLILTFFRFRYNDSYELLPN